jgi:lysyl-tRNA synthetase, class I
MHSSAASRTPPAGQPDRDEQQGLKLLTEGMTGNWTLEGLTTLLYGIPKLQRGLPLTLPRPPPPS